MKTLRIDFVSDVVCPWCAVGLASLEQALQRLQGEVEAEIHFQPFELDPNMPAGGMDVAANLKRKYGMSDAQLAELEAVAQKCPVHKLMTQVTTEISTTVQRLP